MCRRRISLQWVDFPPVPIVVEQQPDHKFSIGNLRAILYPDPGWTPSVRMKRMKGQVVQQGRLLLKHMVPAVLKPARTLWNEIIGFLFLCFGGVFAFAAVRYYLAGDGGRLFIAGFCTILMASFGVSSFRRARKISRS